MSTQYLGLGATRVILPIMVKARQTIALAGVGDLGRHVCEKLIEASELNIVVLAGRIQLRPSNVSRQTEV